MKTKNFFVAKLVAVTLMLGFFSPSISVQEIEVPKKLATQSNFNASEGLLAKLDRTEFTFTLFTQAEARKKKRYKKRRKARRRANRRANYRHHRYHERRRDRAGAMIGAAVVGAVVGAAINEANQD